MFFSCTIKFRVTRNDTGSLLVAYTTANGGVERAIITMLPRAKEINYATITAGIGFSGDSEPNKAGIGEQKATIKLLANGNLVITTNGSVNLPNLTYTFI